MADRVTRILDEDDEDGDDDNTSQEEGSRLCKICNQISTSDARWLVNTNSNHTYGTRIYVHRRDLHSLKSSALNECRLCQLILSTILNSADAGKAAKIGGEKFQDCTLNLGTEKPLSGSTRRRHELSANFPRIVSIALKNIEATQRLHRLSELCGRGRLLLIGTDWPRVLPGNLRAVVLYPSGALDNQDSYRPFITGLEFEFATAPDDPLAPLASAWTASPTLFTDSLLSRIRCWRDTCLSQHSTCRGTRGLQTLPSRVIEVPAGTAPDTVKLRDTRGNRGIYAALSYCWGTQSQRTTTKATLQKHLAGISVLELPATIQDAIKLCQSIDIQYLWIDSLCIVQDDPEDWHHEAAEMASIYGRSALTITTPQNSHCYESFDAIQVTPQDGLPLPQLIWEHHLGKEKTITGTVTVQQKSLTSSGGPPFPYFSRNTESPWMARGWTLQEWLLSPRVLHCGNERVWDCYQTWHNETSPGPPRHFGALNDAEGAQDGLAAHILARMARLDPKGVLGDLDTQWARLAENFTARTLSREMDKMPAIAGLATKFMEHSEAKIPGAKYLAGLWEGKGIHSFGRKTYPTSQLPLGLLWRRSSVEHMRPPAGYRAPSWSWAALDGPVSMFRLEWLVHELFESDVKFQEVKVMQVISARCLFDPPDSFSLVQTGWIIAKSTLKRAYINPSLEVAQFYRSLRSEYHKTFVGLSTHRNREETPWFGIFDQASEQTGVYYVQDSLYLLQVATVTEVATVIEVRDPNKWQDPGIIHHALILERVGIYDGIYCFRRLGVAWYSPSKEMDELDRLVGSSIDWSDKHMLKDWESCRVRLI